MPLNLERLYGISRSEAAREGASSRVRLRQFRLETAEQRAALRRLKLAWGGKREQGDFERLVLAHLALIARQAACARPTLPASQKPSEEVRWFARRAGQVRNFAKRLQKPLGPPLLGLPRPPVCELLLYAGALEVRARELGDQTRNRSAPAVPPAVGTMPFVPGRPARKRKPRPETELILDLIRFVRENTGQPHRSALAVLLRGACDDWGWSKDRVRSLCKDHEPKRQLRGRHVSRHPRRMHAPRWRSPAPAPGVEK